MIAKLACLVVLGLPAFANATTYPCTEAGLDAGLAAGGLVQFSCAAGASIPVSNSKSVAAGTTLDGQSHVTFTGAAGFRLFVVVSGAVTFKNLAITGANFASLGAVLSCDAGTTCTIDQSTLSGNNASSGGAVIYSSSGSIVVTNSTVDGTGGGGNAFMGDTATISVTNTTVFAALRGVIARNGTTATVRNSTFVGMNTGVGAVGATDSVSVGHVLFSGNAADTSGATVTSVGYNVFGAFAGAQATDIVGIPARVSPLASNGGPTQTMALQACSAAIDAGQSPATLTTDQRGAGFPRVNQARQDIGAFESNFTAIPCITTQPLPQTLFATQTLTLSVTAITGTGTLSYQWQRNGVAIAGATSATYTKTAVVADTGTYTVVVTNPTGSVTSTAVAVTVNGPPAITTQPTPQTLFATQTLTLSVTASGASLTYQWRRNTVAIAGATAATYTKTAAVGDAGTYTVVVANPAGSVTSNGVAVVVNGPPAISNQPQNQTLFVGDMIDLSVTATGASLTYQWRHGGTPIAGATASTYSKVAASADAGAYDVVITNPAGSVTSSVATITVNDLAAITSQPTGTEIFAGESFTLTVGATGTALQYEWRHAGTPIPGATAASYMKTGALVADAGDYDVVVSNGGGSETSVVVQVIVNGPPAITRQPTNLTVAEGQPIELSVEADGKSLTYSWQKSGAALADASSATFQIAAAALDDAGEYRVVVSNPAGGVTSDTVAVTVTHAPDDGGCCSTGGRLPRGNVLLMAVVALLLTRSRRR